MAKNGGKMAKNGDGEFGFFICQIRHFSPIFDFGISHLTHFQTANHLETLQSHYTGINTEQTRPILNESEHVLEKANFGSMRGRVT